MQFRGEPAEQSADYCEPCFSKRLVRRRDNRQDPSLDLVHHVGTKINRPGRGLKLSRREGAPGVRQYAENSQKEDRFQVIT
jgi:hypothetical protein